MKAIVTIGMPCSGKSTWAYDHCRMNKAVEVNRDDIRMDIFNLDRYSDYKFSKHKEQQVTWVQRDMIRMASFKGQDVVVSDTNLTRKNRDNLKGFLEDLGYEVEVKFFDIEFFDAIKRNEKRPDKYIPRKVMVDMYKRALTYKKEVGLFKEYTPEYTKPPGFIVDVDGTLAINDGHRSFFEWDKVGGDKVNHSVAQMVRMLSRTHKIVILSGRDGCCQAETEQWLRDHSILYSEIMMRDPGSNEKDRYVKERLFWKAASRFCIHGVLDDRHQVSLLWHDLGVPLFKVGCPITEF